MGKRSTWTSKDDDQLRALAASGENSAAMAVRLNRTDDRVLGGAIHNRARHNGIMDRGINCQRAIKRLTTHSHHRSKESLLSALGSTGFGAADLAFGAAAGR